MKILASIDATDAVALVVPVIAATATATFGIFKWVSRRKPETQKVVIQGILEKVPEEFERRVAHNEQRIERTEFDVNELRQQQVANGALAAERYDNLHNTVSKTAESIARVEGYLSAKKGT